MWRRPCLFAVVKIGHTHTPPVPLFPPTGTAKSTPSISCPEECMVNANDIKKAWTSFLILFHSFIPLLQPCSPRGRFVGSGQLAGPPVVNSIIPEQLAPLYSWRGFSIERKGQMSLYQRECVLCRLVTLATFWNGGKKKSDSNIVYKCMNEEWTRRMQSQSTFCEYISCCTLLVMTSPN